jgi:alkylmercury lyase
VPEFGCSDAPFLAGIDGAEVFPDLVRLIAGGRPVAVEAVAAAMGRPVADVERTLRAQAALEWDQAGRVIGFGLTLRPTDHRVVIGERTLYTWCATDPFLVCLVLDQRVTVESTCPASGRRVRLAVGPGGLTAVAPAGAVVSQRLCGGAVADLRSDVCDHGHFFASPTDAAGWLTGHPDGEAIAVADAFARCRAAAEQLGWAVRGPRGRR